MKEILKAHARLYPKMGPRDAVKLLYQATFGGGHILTDREKAENFLAKERQGVTVTDRPATEAIGGGYARLYLDSAAIRDVPSPLLARLFLLSNQSIPAEMPLFQKRLDLLSALTASGEMPFSSDELKAYLAGYAAEGYPMVSHTEAYHEAYHPAYRVIRSTYARLLPLIAAIEEKKGTQPFVIAIDGRCASGKSTAAALLKTVYPEADLVHMDDFFLPPTLRTPARYAEPGGNVDYDRFRTEVSEKLGKGNFAYTRFDCSKMAFGDQIPVRGDGLVIIEGSYALHPKLGLKTDLRVFSDVAPETQLSRIALRDGEEAKKKFVSTWIPLEEAYFAAFSVRENADILI